MTLYRKLTTALNSVYGNTLIIEREEDSRWDEYFCVSCKHRVSEDRYNHKQSVCYKCWYKED